MQPKEKIRLNPSKAAVARRHELPVGKSEKFMVGAISIDPARHHVSVNGKSVKLTAVEFNLLTTLMRRRGQAQARDRLLNEVWGYKNAIDTRTVDTHVRRLREKLGKAAGAIETVRGVGYRFRES